MAYPQIRINKTKELSDLLKELKQEYRLLTEAEIIKLSLSELYRKKQPITIQRTKHSASWKRRYLAAWSFGLTTDEDEPDNFDPKAVKPINYEDFI